MGGGSTPATQVQQTKSSNEPPEFIQPFLKQLIGDAQGSYNANPKGPAYYPGQTVAGFSPQTESALSALYNRGAAGSPVNRAAQANALATSRGDFLDIGKNPYFQSALSAGFRPQTEQFTSSVLPGVTAQFSGAGRYGSGQHGEFTKLALDSLNQSQADAAAKASSAAYGNERQNQMSVLGTAPGLAAADYADINAMGQAGAARDQLAQQRIDADVARYNYDQNAQFNNIMRYLALANGGYPGGVSSGTTYSSAQAATNPTANAFGMGTELAKLGLSAVFM
jgi:hypothetical protein